MKQFIEKIKKKENLTFEESKSAFELLMQGKVCLLYTSPSPRDVP